jgi:glutamate carboxypeptidase
MLARPVCAYAQTSAESLTPTEQRIVLSVDTRAEQAVAFLQRVVDINSGTFNAAGVRQVATVFTAQLDSLGFASRWVALPDVLQRAGHLFAERPGGHGRRVLLIGHLDTVYERDDEFQHFERLSAETAHGPGVLDDKGGDTALLFALIALRDAGVLDSAAVAVALMGDEEDAGRPTSVSRAALTDLAQRADVALAFEAAAGDMGGASPTRLGFADWALQVHSPIPFSRDGDLRAHPAFAQALRIVQAVQVAFASEPGIQVYPLGVRVDTAATGRQNAALIIQGGIRFMTGADLKRTQSLMSDVARRADHGTTASFVFGEEPYPGMAGRKGNFALLASLDSVSRTLGAGPVVAGDPRKRGGGDIAFISDLVDGLDGLGPTGSGAHSPAEVVDLPSLTLATKRAALLIYRLTHASH